MMFSLNDKMIHHFHLSKNLRKNNVSFSKYYEVFHILLNLTKVFILNDFEIIITIEIL